MSDFAGEMRAAALRWPMHEARLVRLVESGRCPRSLLQKMAARLFQLARRFTGDLAHLAELAPGADLKLFLIGNLLEESGTRIVPGQGLRLDADAVHLNWARAFARACGLDDGALEERIARAPAIDYGWFDRALERRDWLGGTGYLLAQEFNTPRTLAPMLRGLSGMGFGAEDLTFFSVHIVDDEQHGGDGLALLAREATSAGTRAEVLAGIEHGAYDWWQAHN